MWVIKQIPEVHPGSPPEMVQTPISRAPISKVNDSKYICGDAVATDAFWNATNFDF